MKELVEVITKALVDNPDEVVVTEKTGRKKLPLSRFMWQRLTWAKSSVSRDELPRQSVLL